MIFGFFQTVPAEEDDLATGTYADGVAGIASSELSVGLRERGRSFRRNAHERDYGALRTSVQKGAGMVA